MTKYQDLTERERDVRYRISQGVFWKLLYFAQKNEQGKRIAFIRRVLDDALYRNESVNYRLNASIYRKGD